MIVNLKKKVLVLEFIKSIIKIWQPNLLILFSFFLTTILSFFISFALDQNKKFFTLLNTIIKLTILTLLSILLSIFLFTNYLLIHSFKKNSIIYRNPKKIFHSLYNINSIYIDGIGTLTQKELKIDEIIGNKHYWNIAASLCHFSNHHVPHSIAKNAQYNNKTKQISFAHERIGIGINAIYTCSKTKRKITIQLSSLDNMLNRRPTTYKLSKKIEKAIIKIKKKYPYHTIASFSYDSSVKIIFALQNKLQENSYLFVNKLRSLYKNVNLHLVSGENSQISKYLSDYFTMDKFFHSCSPLDKAKIIKKNKKKKICCFIGDSLNDKQAMKFSDLSILFSSTPQQNTLLQAADILIKSDQILNIYKSLVTAKKIKKLLTLAITLNLSLLFTSFLTLALITIQS